MTDRVASLLELEQQVSALLRHVRQFMGDRADAVHPGLTAGGYYVLAWLDANGPLRASAVAEAFKLDKGSVSRKLSHLEEHGFLERTPDPVDGRATLVSVTSEGKEQLAAAAAYRRVWLQQRMDDWTDADLSLLVAMLARYNGALAGDGSP